MVFPAVDNGGLLDQEKDPGDQAAEFALEAFQKKRDQVLKIRNDDGNRDIVPHDDATPESLVDIVAGPTMATLGLKWDGEALGFSLDRMAQKWSEEPLWSTIDAGTLVLAAGLPMMRAWKMGSLGRMLGASQEVFLSRAQAQVAPDIFEAYKAVNWFKAASTPESEVRLLKGLSYIRDDAKEVSPHMVREARALLWQDSRKLQLYHQGQSYEQYSRLLDVEARKQAAMSGGQFVHTDAAVRAKAAEILQQRGHDPVNLSFASDDPNAVSPIDYALYLFDKNFGQRLGALQQEPGVIGELKQDINRRLDVFTKGTRVGEFTKQLDALNDPTALTRMYKHALARTHPDKFKGRVLPAMSADESHIFDSFFSAITQHQTEARELGLAPAGAPIAHLSALLAKGEDIGPRLSFSSASKLIDVLYSPSLLPRYSSVEDVLGRLDKGELLATRSVEDFIGAYASDRHLLFNFTVLRDMLVDIDPATMALRNRYAIPAAEIRKAFGKKVPPNFVSLDKYFNENGFQAGVSTTKRILDKHLAKLNILPKDFYGEHDELPFMSRDVLNGLFGENGFWEQSGNATMNFVTLLTAMHKFMKTGLNPGTHLQNYLGNFATASMAGFNYLAPENTALLEQANEAFKLIHAAQVKAMDKLKTNTPSRAEVIDFVAKELKSSGFKFNYKGQQLDIAELALPMPQNIYLEGAFDSHEGFARFKRFYESGRMTKPAEQIAKRIFNVYDSPTWAGGKIKKIFDTAAKTYMAEDIVPKLAMYVANRAGGASMETATRLVARRMPMYGSVGRVVAASRSWLLPWVSFPAEMVRIMKNNLMDHPLRALPWIYAAGETQALLSAFGMSEATPEGLAEAKGQLPFWAQTPATVVTNSREAGLLGASATGALTGAVAGSHMAGGAGALAGAAVGAAIPQGIQMLSDVFLGTKRDQSELRGAVLNWLPFTSFLPKIRSNQWQATSIAEVWNDAPAEPLAIIKALVEPLFGQTSFGEIQAPTLGAKALKIMSSFIGFLSPPWMQKYGFHTPTPDVGLMDALVGRRLTDASVFNVRRLLVDSGAAVDPITGRPGSPVMDMLLNTGGLWRSYQALGELHDANQLLVEEGKYSEMRSYYAKQLSFYSANGYDDEMKSVVRRVYDSYNLQYAGDPQHASLKFGEWLQRQATSLGRHPALRNLPNEDLDRRLQEATAFSSKIRSMAYNQWREALIQERRVRGVESWNKYWEEMTAKFAMPDGENQ